MIGIAYNNVVQERKKKGTCGASRFFKVTACMIPDCLFINKQKCLIRLLKSLTPTSTPSSLGDFYNSHNDLLHMASLIHVVDHDYYYFFFFKKCMHE